MAPPPRPTFPVSDDPGGEQNTASVVRWGVRIGVFAVVVVVLVAVILFLHLSGVVGPGAH